MAAGGPQVRRGGRLKGMRGQTQMARMSRGVSMTLRRLTSKRQWRSALLGAFGLVLILGASHALAADDDEEDLTIEQKIMRGLLGGIMTPGPEIDYRERSPLVVPPSRDLPSPDK